MGKDQDGIIREGCEFGDCDCKEFKLNRADTADNKCQRVGCAHDGEDHIKERADEGPRRNMLTHYETLMSDLSEGFFEDPNDLMWL
jgi:hypothetical protein